MTVADHGTPVEEPRAPRPEPPTPPSPAGVTGPVCDLCGTPMDERHCKLICPTCGYTRDCSDP